VGRARTSFSFRCLPISGQKASCLSGASEMEVEEEALLTRPALGALLEREVDLVLARAAVSRGRR
jgi:hypothetical protein